MEVRRSALVAHPAERIFALIETVEDYPAFLPWCAGVTVLERDEQVVAARLEVAWAGVRFRFATRNPKRAPTWMAIGLREGPFRQLEGEWNLTPLAAWGCRVELLLRYEFSATVLGRLAAPVFEHAANTLVDAFVQRADQLALAAPQPGTSPATAEPCDPRASTGAPS